MLGILVGSAEAKHIISVLSVIGGAVFPPDVFLLFIVSPLDQTNVTGFSKFLLSGLHPVPDGGPGVGGGGVGVTALQQYPSKTLHPQEILNK